MRLLNKWLQELRSLFIKSKPTGYFEDLPDSRDYELEVSGSLETVEIPSFSNYGYLPNQGSTQSCVGFTLARLMQVIIWQETGVYTRPSEHFIWFNAKDEAGWAFENKGVYPRDAIKRLFKDGYVPRSMLPSSPSFDYEPTDYQYALAESLVAKILLKLNYKYYRVGKADAIKLSNGGQPVAVSLPVATDWSSVGKNGRSNSLTPTRYYHYMSLEGTEFIDGVEYGRFMNWWGKRYLYVPKQYFMDYAQDLWTITNL